MYIYIYRLPMISGVGFVLCLLLGAECSLFRAVCVSVLFLCVFFISCSGLGWSPNQSQSQSQVKVF